MVRMVRIHGSLVMDLDPWRETKATHAPLYYPLLTSKFSFSMALKKYGNRALLWGKGRCLTSYCLFQPRFKSYKEFVNYISFILSVKQFN